MCGCMYVTRSFAQVRGLRITCTCDIMALQYPRQMYQLDNCSVVNTDMWYHRGTDNRENSILYGFHIIYASTPCGPGGYTECTFQYIGNRRLVCSPEIHEYTPSGPGGHAVCVLLYVQVSTHPPTHTNTPTHTHTSLCGGTVGTALIREMHEFIESRSHFKSFCRCIISYAVIVHQDTSSQYQQKELI